MTVTRDGQHLRCDAPECATALVKNHRWAKTRAADWFTTRDGKHYCPDHLPAWVPAWRASKKEKP